MQAHSHFRLGDFGADNKNLKRLATWSSVLVALILIVAKGYGWHKTHSLSILSSLTDSGLDLFSSLINMIAVHHAIKPADDEHRFGHGKIEALAALFQSIVIIFSSGFVLKEAFEHLFNPQPIQYPIVGIWVTVLSVFLTVVLVRLQRYVIKKTKSIAILADSAHYKGDLYLNVGVLFSIAFYMAFKWSYVDIIFGSGIAVYVMIMAYQIIRSSLSILLDNELSEEDRQRILNVIEGHSFVKECRHLKTRSSGQEEFVQGHLVISSKLSLKEVHTVVQEIERAIRNLYPHAECLFQVEPESLEETR